MNYPLCNWVAILVSVQLFAWFLGCTSMCCSRGGIIPGKIEQGKIIGTCKAGLLLCLSVNPSRSSNYYVYRYSCSVYLPQILVTVLVKQLSKQPGAPGAPGTSQLVPSYPGSNQFEPLTITILSIQRHRYR